MEETQLIGSRFICPYADCSARFSSVGAKKRHLREGHPEDSLCSNGCKPSTGDVCSGPRCS